MIPHICIRKKLDGPRGTSRFFIIWIDPRYDATDILAHEQRHVLQWWLTMLFIMMMTFTVLPVDFRIPGIIFAVFFHNIAMRIPLYRLWMEVDAFKQSMRYTGYPAEYYAKIIHEQYNTGASYDKILRMLK